MIKKFKEMLEYRNAKKTVTLLLLNSYFELVEAQKEKEYLEIENAKIEKTVYEELTKFSKSDMNGLFDNIAKIAENPQLTTEFYDSLLKHSKDDNVVNFKGKKNE